MRGEGIFKLRVMRPLPSFPPPPFGAALPCQTPERKVGPTKRCVSPIADGWGSVVAAVLRGHLPFLGDQESGTAD